MDILENIMEMDGPQCPSWCTYDNDTNCWDDGD